MGWDNKIQRAVLRHARDDMAAAPGASQMHPEARPMTFLQWVRDNHAKQPTLWSELRSITREAIKDIRQTMNEFFFGRPEHAPEAGTPLNPTAQVVTAGMGNFHGYSASADEAQSLSLDQQLNLTARSGGQPQRERGLSR